MARSRRPAAPTCRPSSGRYFERDWSHGEGHRLYDTAGRGYLDFANGIAVTALGHAHPRVTAAIHAQVDRLIGPVHAIGFTEPTVAARRRARGDVPGPARLRPVPELRLGGDRRGAQARAAGSPAGPGSSRSAGGFHGRTFGATTVTSSNLNYRTGYEPLLPGVYLSTVPGRLPDFGGDEDAPPASHGRPADAARDGHRRRPRSRPSSSSPSRARAATTPAPPAFLRELRAFCDEHGILLIADEVQSGYGRTGGCGRSSTPGIVPDVVVVAKAIANGLPLSAIVASSELQERWGRGAHGSTYGGNPVACAAGVAVLETIRDEGLVANAAARGAELSGGPARADGRAPAIGDVRGPGLMIGVELHLRECAAALARPFASARERRTPALRAGVGRSSAGWTCVRRPRLGGSGGGARRRRAFPALSGSGRGTP